MPKVVALTGYAGLIFCLIAFVVFGSLIWTGPLDDTPPSDVEFDKVALPCTVILSAIGIVIAVGMLRHSAMAYKWFVMMMGLIAALGVFTALAMTGSWGKTAGATGFSGAVMLLRQMLVAERVRTYFGLPKIERNLVAAPGWWNLGLGILAVVLTGFPVPTPMFGLWLERWQIIAMNILFAAGYIALGWGLLTDRKWVWLLTVALALVSFAYCVGMAWDPNPLGRLEPIDAMTDHSIAKSTIFGIAFASWTLWRIWLHNRERHFAQSSPHIPHSNL